MNKKISFHFQRPEENLGYLLWQTTMLWQKQMNRALDKINLTHTQFVIMAALGWLLKNSEDVTQKEIADHSNTDRMMVSKILRTLQKNELIERKEHETDTRAKCVFLTDKGVDTLQKAIEIKTQANNLFFGKLSDKQKFGNELRNITE
ncbi:MarR family winged helix-turn-helix transcriptional regulator [Cellulophaga baltica]|uniref:Transcriptional regulator, MarR family n=1 Tax=Cellulophaga baltica TaxID=76594 RepID=A0A1G7MER1_9FLAO|nr:MarR family transcriptional regulator [Cellulophaga baltica]SDF60253.1 transcriptional regulator, MarR family [Cellulophaga baltica]